MTQRVDDQDRRNDDYWQVYFDLNYAISQAIAREHIRLRAS